VEPTAVNDTIHGALVEVHFELCHYFISSDCYNSFNGIVEQILVLQPGKSPPDTVYKCKNIGEGLICMNPTLVAQQQSKSNAPVASGSNTFAHVTSSSPIASGSSITAHTITLSTVSKDGFNVPMGEDELTCKYCDIHIQSYSCNLFSV
jgi:hypothetical protein